VIAGVCGWHLDEVYLKTDDRMFYLIFTL